MLGKRFEDATVIRSDTPNGKQVSIHMLFGPDPSLHAGDLGPDDIGPQLFLARFSGSGHELPPHFHIVDQYQVVVEGDGSIGKHDLRPGSVHYADGSTPYGPIKMGEGGMSFFTVRHEADTGGHYMPKDKKDMKTKAGRNLVWSLTIHDESKPVDVGIEQDDGVLACTISANAGDTIEWPDPTAGAGQLAIVLAGSCSIDGQEFGRWSAFEVANDDAPPAAVPGPDGVKFLVMQFGRGRQPAEAQS